MRTLHIDTGREMRGGQWQALYLVEGLVRAGHQALLLARSSGPLFRTARERGLDVRPAGVAALARWSGRSDLVHAHDARGHSLAALVARAPLIVSRRVAFPVRRGWLSRWKYGRVKHCIAVSEFVRRRLLEAGVPPERISVVYDGVPLGEAGPGGGLVIAPATDDPAKGNELLRSAAALGGFEVRFSRHLDQDLRRDAAVFAYITHQEGLGSAVLLAMAAGAPVVASRVGGLPEAVLDGQTGLLTENTPQAIAAAVRRMLDRPDAARAMAAAARSRAESLFSVEAMVRGTLQVYHRVLSC
jgi:glycosyltransferase involved in cell wall biosynthesis